MAASPDSTALSVAVIRAVLSEYSPPEVFIRVTPLAGSFRPGVDRVTLDEVATAARILADVVVNGAVALGW